MRKFPVMTESRKTVPSGIMMTEPSFATMITVPCDTTHVCFVTRETTKGTHRRQPAFAQTLMSFYVPPHRRKFLSMFLDIHTNEDKFRLFNTSVFPTHTTGTTNARALSFFFAATYLQPLSHSLDAIYPQRNGSIITFPNECEKTRRPTRNRLQKQRRRNVSFSLIDL